MKKLIILLIFIISLIASSSNLFAQNATISSTGEVQRSGNTFIASARTNKSNAQQTQYTWKDSKSNEYPIYISTSGSCYVIKTSKKQVNNIKVIYLKKLVLKYVKN